MLRTLTPVFAILLAIIVYFFFTKPIFEELVLIKEDLAKFDTALAKAGEVQSELKSLVAQKNNFGMIELDRLNALVPTRVDEVKLLADLKEMSRSLNILMGNFEVSRNTTLTDDSARGVEATVVDYADMHHSDISFAIIGTYENLKQLLMNIERSLVLLDVVNVTLGTAGADLMQFDITVRAYALPEVELVTDI